MSTHLDASFLRAATFCECGCGQRTFPSKYTASSRGIKKGEAPRFLLYHHLRLQGGENNYMWEGGTTRSQHGYVYIRATGHPRARGEGHYVPEHILVMEKIVGRYLSRQEVVHHKNGVKFDNGPENLQLFSCNADHQIEHRKLRAFAACGNREWLVCTLCGKYDDPINLHVISRGAGGKKAWHSSCRSAVSKKWRLNHRRMGQEVLDLR